MLTRITLSALLTAALCAPVSAQEATPADGETPKPVPAPKAGAETPKPAPPAKQAATGAEQAQAPAEGQEVPLEVKVLKPTDVPAERIRIKSKADIKCEVTITPQHGRDVTVKGVVRNGKLIERFAGRVFVEDPTVENPQCGVRLWWVENTEGWIFLRYSQIRTIALTGILTAEEKQAILEQVQAKQKESENKQKAQEAAKLEEDLVKMTGAELEAYLLREYPADQNWNHERLRDLKKKQLIDNQPLTREESVFVAYFPTLIKARLKDLKREKDKFEFEPGSAVKPSEPAPAGEAPGSADAGSGASAPVGGGAPVDDEPATGDSEE
jgi:hypothetical protein